MLVSASFPAALPSLDLHRGDGANTRIVIGLNLRRHIDEKQVCDPLIRHPRTEARQDLPQRREVGLKYVDVHPEDA